MQGSLKKTICLLIMVFMGACNFSQATPIPVTPTIPATPSHFSENETTTLASLKKVDDYPLYTMQYFGEYAPRETSLLPALGKAHSTPGWACSLFTVLLDEDHLLYGRNFDWEYSPAMLLFTDPPDGYASVSIVAMQYLDISSDTISNLADLTLDEREGLLYAPYLPFDGMNEHGLAIGMAAVDPGGMQADLSKETIGSLGIIREMLDHARNVDEAVDLIRRYNIDFGGPPLHYLIADANRKSVLVEFYRGEMHVIENEKPWHFATNFLLSSVLNPRDGNCWRYDTISHRMNETQGMLDARSAMELLADVAQDNTQWSVVYQMALGEVSITMDRDYSEIHTFYVSDFWNP